MERGREGGLSVVEEEEEEAAAAAAAAAAACVSVWVKEKERGKCEKRPFFVVPCEVNRIFLPSLPPSPPSLPPFLTLRAYAPSKHLLALSAKEATHSAKATRTSS